MKKTLNINLGGMAFIIDENAFELLYSYLEALKKKFKNEAERDEIINDIEARIAEMLTHKLAGRKEVLSVEEVEYVISQMGKPEDIAGDEPQGETETTSTNAGAGNTTYTPPQPPVQKRLFRDPDDAKVAGVISGLCHYFGINDPVWLRIAAVILIPLTSGSIILVYLLLAIVVPKALTSAEKLQMKGEPINISTIEKEVKDAAGKFSATVTASFDSDDFFQRMWMYTSKAARVFLKIIIAFVALIATGALIGVLGGFITFFAFGTTPFNGLTHFIVDSSSTISWFSIGYLFFCGAPLIALIYVCIRAIVGSTVRVRWLKWVLLGLWLIGAAILAFTTAKVVLSFKESATVKDTYVLMQPANNTLYVQLADSTDRGWDTADEDEDGDRTDWSVLVNGQDIDDIQSLRIDEPELQLIPSENDSFYIHKVITARGSSRQNAIKNARLVTYAFAQTDSTLNLSQYFELPKDKGKYRAQNIKIRIAVPKGKFIKFAGNIDEWAAIVKNDNSYDDTYFANTTWTTTPQGRIKCLTCAVEDLSKEEIITEDITEVNGDTVKTTVTIKSNKAAQDKPADNKGSDSKNEDY